jgi:hypothetical protein
MYLKYEDYSKIKLRSVGKYKRVGIPPNHKFSCNKQSLLSLSTNSHAFSLSSVAVIVDETWTLSTPLPPTVRYELWSVFFMQKDKARPRFIVDCDVNTVIMLWVTVVWENGAENSRMGLLMFMKKVLKDDTQLSLMNSFTKSLGNFVDRIHGTRDHNNVRGLLLNTE